MIPGGTGHTGQYGTIARALGYAAGYMEDDLEELAYLNAPVSAASLRMEARFITVTVLSATLTEALANVALTQRLTPEKLKGLKRRGFLDNWMINLPEACGVAQILSRELIDELTLLRDVRNSIVHAKTQTFVEGNVVHEGRVDEWELLTPETVRGFVSLPLRLIAAVPQKPDDIPIQVWANDHWLVQAIKRGRGDLGHTPNEWRPPDWRDHRAAMKEERSRRAPHHAHPAL